MLTFLWLNRERSRPLSSRWIRNCAKRALAFPALLSIAWRLHRLKRRGARIGPGTVFAPARVNGARWLTVGTDTFIGRVHMQAQAEIRIGSHVCINDGVRLLTATHDVRDPGWTQTSAPIVIGDFAWIATGSTILPGVRIGRGAVVGACAVVASDIPDFAVAVGNPAKLREDVRAKFLDYSPVRFIALYTAWLGAPAIQPAPVIEPKLETCHPRSSTV